MRAPAGANLTSTALLAPDGSMRLVLVDEEPPGSPVASVHVRVGPGYRAAGAISLTAPSPQALLRRLPRRQLGRRDGSWPGPSRTSALPVAAQAPSRCQLAAEQRCARDREPVSCGGLAEGFGEQLDPLLARAAELAPGRRGGKRHRRGGRVGCGRQKDRVDHRPAAPSGSEAGAYRA